MSAILFQELARRPGLAPKISWNYLLASSEDSLNAQKSKFLGHGLMSHNPAERSDAELLRLSLAGDEAAFVVLYDRLKGTIFRYAYYMTSSKTAAEEVTQEVFMCLLTKGSQYREAQGDLAGFAFGIARNFVRRYRQRERVYEALPVGQSLEDLSADLIEGDAASAAVLRNDTLRKTRNAIASLPERYRQAVVHCDLCELSYAEAASRLGCAVGTVRSRLHRAHALLQRKLQQTKEPQTRLRKEECLI